MLSPSSVKGQDKNAFFQTLIDRTGTEPNWNFNKYLVSKDHPLLNILGQICCR
ncbi:MAG: glutathione peroxidase-family protein [Oleiphilaceae bacterium]|jgi:glutathione peroxidase-family protein